MRADLFVLTAAFCGFQSAPAASISAPTRSLVADSPTLTNDDLSVTGTQDWQLYDGSFTPPTQK